MFVVFIHRDDEFFTYPSSAKIVPSYFSLMVYCFVIGSVGISYLGIVKGLETMDEEGGYLMRSIERVEEVLEEI